MVGVTYGGLNVLIFSGLMRVVDLGGFPSEVQGLLVGRLSGLILGFPSEV